jgi:hypothetical protein
MDKNEKKLALAMLLSTISLCISTIRILDIVLGVG